MSKPKGGRGISATKPTIMRRIPKDIESVVIWLADEFRADNWDGTRDGLLNLISSLEPIENPTKKGIREILKRVASQETGYTTKSFSRGLKRLKRLVGE